MLPYPTATTRAEKLEVIERITERFGGDYLQGEGIVRWVFGTYWNLKGQ